jgi:transcriptional antiterminator NusG
VTDESNQIDEAARVEVAEGAEADSPTPDQLGANHADAAHEDHAPTAKDTGGEAATAQEVNGEQAEVVEHAEAETTADGAIDGLADDEVAEEPEEQVETSSGPVYVAPAEDDEIKMDWYILKVQSNRERSIAEAVERKIKVEGLDKYFDQVIVPTEKVTEFKGGKKKVVERKLYPGYIVVHMHINDDTWFAVRETSGVGDFTGAGGKPTPMLPHEVAKIIQTETEETEEAPKLDIKFAKGDKVKVKEGNFESFEGEVGSIDEASGRVTVMINIFGRSTPVELEYWQIEAM